MVLRELKCEQCISALFSTHDHAHSKHSFSLFERKLWGKLISASDDVIKVCLETEKHINFLYKTQSNQFVLEKNLSLRLASGVTKVLMLQCNQTFQNLSSHATAVPAESNHIYSLISLISCSFSKIRLHHLAREKNCEITIIFAKGCLKLSCSIISDCLNLHFEMLLFCKQYFSTICTVSVM